MLYEKKCRAHIRRVIRKARQEWSTVVLVYPSGESDRLNERQHEGDILDSVFCMDETEIVFHDTIRGVDLGYMLIVLEHDRTPDEIISDYSDNAYTQRLVDHAESKLC